MYGRRYSKIFRSREYAAFFRLPEVQFSMEIALPNSWHEAVIWYSSTLERGHANSDKEQSYCLPDIPSSIKGISYHCV